MAPPPAKDTPKSNFLRGIIERDLEAGTWAQRHFGGSPGDAAHHQAGGADPARIRTRFPPEPNGYLHVGHAKSICLNFGLAQDYGGVCHLRFDDTNPEKEEQEYVDAIKRWCAGWASTGCKTAPATCTTPATTSTSCTAPPKRWSAPGLAYVDEQTPEQMRANRGDFNTPGTDSPFRSRTPAENLARLREMRDGQHADGAWCCAPRSTWRRPTSTCATPRCTASSAPRTTTPATAGASTRCTPTRTRSRTRWKTSPTASARWSSRTSARSTTGCWKAWPTLGLLSGPLPRQHEFGRLNLSYVITSKRKLRELVDEGIVVSGWDDPRMPTLFGMRRRGYTPASIRAMADGTGASKTNIWLDYACSKAACAPTWKARRRARWRCSTRCR
jgi:glutaminyl-tRNA synthetase